MRKSRALHRYNQIALAIFLTWAVMFAGVTSYYWLFNTDEYEGDWTGASATDPTVTGEEISTSDGVITAYKSASSADPEALQGVRYVAMSTGRVATIADDDNALIFSEKAVGSLGRIALVQTGSKTNRPIFDVVFVSFPDLNRHVIAKSIDALDTVQELDDNRFSAIIWYKKDQARFVVIDAKKGLILEKRDLDLSGVSKRKEAAPEAKALNSAAAAVEEAAAAVDIAPNM